MGMTTATGGRIRCEIIQSAMSSFAMDRWKRRRVVDHNTRKSPPPAGTAISHGTFRPTARPTRRADPTNCRTTPRRGR